MNVDRYVQWLEGGGGGVGLPYTNYKIMGDSATHIHSKKALHNT